MQFIEFLPVAEFTDRYGKTRAIPTCSILGREEFFERIAQVQQRLSRCEGEEGWQQLYDRDERLQFLITRCLELNGINPDWVSIDQLEPLLFHRKDVEKDEYLPGWLVELNTPKKPEGKQSGAPLTLNEIIALIALTNSQSVAEALNEAATVPAATMMSVIEAKSELQDPEYKERRKQKTMRKKLEGPEFDRLMRIPINQLKQVKRI